MEIQKEILPSKIRINENVEMDISDVLFVKDWSEIGNLVSAEDFLEALDGIADEKDKDRYAKDREMDNR